MKRIVIITNDENSSIYKDLVRKARKETLLVNTIEYHITTKPLIECDIKKILRCDEMWLHNDLSYVNTTGLILESRELYITTLYTLASVLGKTIRFYY